MASPQKENGYTPIANEIMKALAKTRIRGEEMQVLFAILIKTYGYHKKQDSIAISQLQELTVLPRQSVCRALNGLKARNIITSHKNAPRTPSTYAFNKDYDKWVPSHKIATTSHKNATSASHNFVSQLVTKLRPSKENNTKEKKRNNVEKAKAEKIPFEEIIFHLNQQTGKKFRVVDEHKRHISARWNDGFRLNDFKAVIDHKCKSWINDPKMRKYLRPETLFGTKFDSYLNEVPNSDDQQFSSSYSKPIPPDPEAEKRLLAIYGDLQ